MAESDTVTVTCPTCEGHGQIAVAQCAALVGKMEKGGRRRRCSQPVRYAPDYYSSMPERDWLKPFCARHGNALMRGANGLRRAGMP